MGPIPKEFQSKRLRKSKMVNYRLFNKDCRSMTELPDGSVHCVVTSPPYWGLRKYVGDQDLVWGGDKDCQHEWGRELEGRRKRNENDIKDTLSKEATKPASAFNSTGRSFCIKCGYWKGAFGLEPTVDLYIQHSVEILREIRRVLRPDGVVFWNIGDSYASGKGTCFNPGGGKGSFSTHGDRKDAGVYPLDRGNVSMLRADGLKPKDLCLIPERFALAAQQDGWWVRTRICWNKPNPMPESVRDRPTDSWEHIWMLTKSARYYYDAEAVREPVAKVTIAAQDNADRRGMDSDNQAAEESLFLLPPNNDYTNPRPPGSTNQRWAARGRKYKGSVPLVQRQEEQPTAASRASRNLRSVWTFPTVPHPGAHIATFPERLPELCIKASTPEVGVCAKCGAPWARVVDRGQYEKHETEAFDLAVHGDGANKSKHAEPVESKTIGWRQSCKCNTIKPLVPAIVLDPFAGAGTTLLVALKLRRQAIGYELSSKYCDLIRERLSQVQIKLQ